MGSTEKSKLIIALLWSSDGVLQVTADSSLIYGAGDISIL